MTSSTVQMTTRPHPDPVGPAGRAGRASAIGVTQLRVLRSEWTKFRSLRSPLWTLLVAVVATIGFGAIVTAVRVHHLKPDDLVGFKSIGTSLAGLTFGQLAIGVLGVLLISGEYSTGMIRASLTSVPKRLPVLWAKLGVTAAVSFVVMFVTSLVAFFLGQALLSSHHLNVGLGSSDALRSVFGAALAVTAMAVMGMALGALLRNTAAAISTLVAVFFVLPPVMDLLPSSFSTHVTPYLPSEAANSLYQSLQSNSHSLGFGSALLVVAIYLVVLTAAAAWLLRKRDA